MEDKSLVNSTVTLFNFMLIDTVGDASVGMLSSIRLLKILLWKQLTLFYNIPLVSTSISKRLFI